MWLSCSKFPGLLNKDQKFLFKCSRTRVMAKTKWNLTYGTPCICIPSLLYIIWKLKKYPTIGFVQTLVLYGLMMIVPIEELTWQRIISLTYLMQYLNHNLELTNLIFYISTNKFDINTPQQSCSIWADFHFGIPFSIFALLLTLI